VYIPKKLIGVVFSVAALFALVACGGTTQTTAQQQAAAIAAGRNYYVPKNDVEGNNYNKRLQLADDPSTILWCTSAFSTQGSPYITVPIVGKLTSGNKRPFPTEQVQYESSYNPEIPGADGMYGSSGEYRYGFTVSGNYIDFYNIETFCTSEPTVWQKENTKIVLASDNGLMDADRQAADLIKQGKNAEANALLQAAIEKAGGK
jgi:hypothetical protein